MYLRRLELTDVRAFQHLAWEIDPVEAPGWHVFIGPNGSGKSTLLKAAAIAFVGAIEFRAARRPAQDFIRRADGTEKAQIQAFIVPSEDWDTYERRGRKVAGSIDASITLLSDGTIKANALGGARTIWGNGRGWFSAAFGPMRRLSGGNSDNFRLFASYRRLSRHLSIFGEDVALVEILEWLRDLRFKELEHSSGERRGASQLEKVTTFINQPGFLPFGVKLVEVTSEQIVFCDANGVELPILDLSDGYRTVLALTFEIIRLMLDRYGEQEIFTRDFRQIRAPGVILIDEVDVHLHPLWQREIGPWLTQVFPAVQFLVTTHSPYVCQSALRGSVWAFAEPGSDAAVHRLEGEQLKRVLYGDVLNILNSEAFGGLPTRSDHAIQLLDRLAELNRQAHLDNLTHEEVKERESLEDAVGSVAIPEQSPVPSDEAGEIK
jgi:predicted ATPase